MKPENLVIGKHYTYTIPSTKYFIKILGKPYDDPAFSNPYAGLEFTCIYEGKTHSSTINFPDNVKPLEGNYYEFIIVGHPNEASKHYQRFTLPELFIQDHVDPFISIIENITDLYLI
jgi:hypothetical protein